MKKNQRMVRASSSVMNDLEPARHHWLKIFYSKRNPQKWFLEASLKKNYRERGGEVCWKKKMGRPRPEADGSMDFNREQCTLGVTASASRSTFTAALSRGQRFPFDR